MCKLLLVAAPAAPDTDAGVLRAGTDTRSRPRVLAPGLYPKAQDLALTRARRAG